MILLTHEEEYAIDNFKELVENYGPLLVIAITKLQNTIKEQDIIIKRLEKELKLYREG